jgi:putative inorganic carbon (hco3(-)) transporter
VFYWALLVLRRSGRDALPKYVLLAVAVGATLLAAYALVDFFAAGGTWRDRLVRARAIGSDYNWLSTYMVMAIPVLGSMLVVSYARWARGAQILALVLTGLAQIFSYTRAGWVAHVVQGIVLAIVTGRRRVGLAVLGGITVVGLVLVLASFAGVQGDTVNATTVETRVTVWRIGLGEILAHPIVGIGYGNNSFVKKYPEYAIQAQSHIPVRAQVIPAMHSAFLMVALGSGLPALVCFVWIFVALLWTLFSRPSVPSDSKTWSLMVVGIGVALVGFSLRNLFDYMFTGSLAHLFLLLAAIGVMIKTSNRNHNIRVA